MLTVTKSVTKIRNGCDVVVILLKLKWSPSLLGGEWQHAWWPWGARGCAEPCKGPTIH